MKRLALTLAAAATGAAMLSLPASAQNPDKIRPGYWEYKYRVLGIPVDTEHKCVKASEIDKVFFAGPCNRHHTCVYPVREIGDGKARYQGTWTDKRGRVAKIKASGTYTQTTFKLKASGTTTTGIPMAATMDAHWVADACPAGAE